MIDQVMANRCKQCKTNKTDARLVLLLERRPEIHVDENGRHRIRRLLNLPIVVMIDLNAQQKKLGGGKPEMK